MIPSKGVSVVVASIRDPETVTDSIQALGVSLSQLPGPAEIVLVRDSPPGTVPAEWMSAAKVHPVTVIWTGRRRGSSFARRLGVDNAAYDTLLFTDDDVVVPPDWAARMALGVEEHGIVTGLIQSRTEGFFERCDELIDHYRTAARAADGTVKFVSFPNLGITRTVFDSVSLDLSAGNRVDDIELACRLRLSGAFPQLVETAVAVLYPSTYRSFIGRKVRHGIGMGRLRGQLGAAAWDQLELGQATHLLRRWIALSRQITPCAGVVRRLQVTSANIAYCFAFMITAALFHNGTILGIARTRVGRRMFR
ncbi:glycosyltransferase family 2 protein [Solwaraspora sp. WMMB335]|uniref:glycosyltransferase family 2 protein n=1 Tax=Solwaraspora sp. WMMB335 TaxID=3404118 RepID=UPI003B9414D2